MNNNEFIIQVSEDASKELEKTSYELDRECMNCVRLITKNIPFKSIGLQKHVDTLAQKVVDYDNLKDKMSEDIVMPQSIAKWGNKVSVSWSLNFQTKNITVTYNSTDSRASYDSVIDVESVFAERMRFLSIRTKTYEEIYDKIIATSPTLDTAAYVEFLDEKEKLDNEYEDMKFRVRDELVNPWLAENFPTNEDVRFDWTMHFATAKISIVVD